eukprot:448179-Rhodomonas_salina.1
MIPLPDPEPGQRPLTLEQTQHQEMIELQQDVNDEEDSEAVTESSPSNDEDESDAPPELIASDSDSDDEEIENRAQSPDSNASYSEPRGDSEGEFEEAGARFPEDSIRADSSWPEDSEIAQRYDTASNPSIFIRQWKAQEKIFEDAIAADIQASIDGIAPLTICPTDPEWAVMVNRLIYKHMRLFPGGHA